MFCLSIFLVKAYRGRAYVLYDGNFLLSFSTKGLRLKGRSSTASNTTSVNNVFICVSYRIHLNLLHRFLLELNHLVCCLNQDMTGEGLNVSHQSLLCLQPRQLAKAVIPQVKVSFAILFFSILYLSILFTVLYGIVFFVKFSG